jgi:hypothetical protein
MCPLRNDFFELFLKTVRIDTLGEKSGVATGFFYELNAFSCQRKYIVTNKHVIKGKKEITLNFIEKKSEYLQLGKIIKYPIKEPELFFTFHKNYDIAILPFEPIIEELKSQMINIAYSTISNMQSADFWRYDAVEPVFFVGYPKGLWDSENGLPICRQGTTASALGVNFKNENKFLIDANTIPGSSGSPVFIRSESFNFDEEERAIQDSKKYSFAGILYAGYYARMGEAPIEMPIPESIEDHDARYFINIGSVISYDAILNFIIETLKENGEWQDPFF